MQEIGKLIRNRRMQLNLSQQQLADLMGYRSRSTIAKIEKGENDIPRSKVNNFAKVLKTTPEYLMGWEEMNRKEEKPMLYVKKKFHEGTADEIEVKFDLYDDEIYCICPECGKEVQLDKESLIAILEDGDFAHSALCCKDCSQKIGGK